MNAGGISEPTTDQVADAFEDLAARADHAARQDLAVRTFRLGARERTVGGTDPWAAQGWRYIERLVAEHGIEATADVADTGGGIYVPIVRIADTHIVAIVDDDPGRYLCVFQTVEQWDQREGEDIRYSYGLTGSQMLAFLRAAVDEVAAGATA